MTQYANRHPILNSLLQFVRLQLAGNILFIGTLLGVAVADTLLSADPFHGLIVGSALAHVLFFYVNKTWIFGEDTSTRNDGEVLRFVLFMSFNFFLNLFLVELATSLVLHHLPGLEAFAYYIGVVCAALFFAVWSFAGLKFWVFRPTKRHAAASRHAGLTYEKVHETAHDRL